MLKEKFLTLIGKYSEDKVYNLEYWNEIEKYYSSKSRHYHNLEHMLEELNKIESKVDNLDCLLFTIYFHDIIYKSIKSDNEHQSALVFEKKNFQNIF